MNASDPSAANRALYKARQAMQSGDRLSARRWAELAASLDPKQEEPWLILASLASARASVAYFEQALKMNPTSSQARQGLHQAVDRLRRTGAEPGSRPSSSVGDTQPSRAGGRSRGPIRQTPPTTPPPSSWSLTKYRRSFVTLLLLLASLTFIWALWPGNAVPALAFIRESLVVQQPSPTDPGGPAQVDKPTYTPTITLTPTPTATFTPTSTFTFTPTPTETFTPTITFTPWPTPLPTNSPIPQPTLEQYVSPGNLGGDGVRWIDVDLSQQMLYAYEGDTIVASFLVSTGVWQYPTVTGKFHIYVKYLYTDMAGPGYYLPNVPYTMYFYKGYGIHGTYWHNNFGHPMSHGCVNVSTPDAAWLYGWASVGTPVVTHL